MKQPTPKLLIIVTTALFTACGYPGPPRPPSLNLPQPVKDLRATRKGNNVYLTWTVPTQTTDSLAIRHFGPTRVCRSAASNMSDCGTSVGEVAAAAPVPATKPAPKMQQSFTDVLPPALLSENPSAQIVYAVSVLNDRGRSAGISNVVDIPAMIAPPPPADFHAEVTAAGVVLSWTPVPPEGNVSPTRYLYRVYRREAGGAADTLAGEAPLGSSHLTDQNFDWEKTYLYRATVVTIIEKPGEPASQFESDDTPPVKLFAHDVFPPATPSGLQAAFSGVGQQPFIDLIWAPDTEVDLAGYNIYRHEQGGEPVKINSQTVKTPSFRDGDVASGHTYIYSVSAVDIRGNESGRSSDANETVP
jgi:hypothetical protein